LGLRYIMIRKKQFTLIIVDDEKSIRDGLSNYIDWQSLGFRVLQCFEDGKEAEEFIIRNPVDVILTDIKMAEISGLELAENLLRKNIHTKIVIMSGYKDFSYAQKAIKLNVYDYLLKPIEIDTIKEVFDSLYTLIENGPIESPETAEKVQQENNTEYTELVIQKAIEYIENNYQKDISLDDVSGYVYLSPVYFCRFFKEETNINFLTYLTNVRMGKAAEILIKREKKISEVSHLVGYKNTKYFTRVFKKHYGIVPSEYLKQEFRREF